MFGVKPPSTSQSNSPRTNSYSNNIINYNNENNEKNIGVDGNYIENNGNIDSYDINEKINPRISLFNSLKNMAINAVNISSFTQIKNNNNNNNSSNINNIINNKSPSTLNCNNYNYESAEYQNNILGNAMNNSPAGIVGPGLSSISINCSRVNTPRDYKGEQEDFLLSIISVKIFRGIYFFPHSLFLSHRILLYSLLFSILFSLPVSPLLSSSVLLPSFSFSSSPSSSSLFSTFLLALFPSFYFSPFILLLSLF